MNKQTITLSTHQQNWVKNFNLIAELIKTQCGNTILAIEHIGSTAIKKIKAKDIIDMQCGINSFSAIPQIKAKLEPLGFTLLDHIKQDHVPFHDHDYFEPAWEKRFFRGEYQGIECHLHMRIYESKNWHYAIDFRDYLNDNPKVAIAYEQIKERLQQANVSRDEYCLIKDPVFDLIYYQMSLANLV